MMDAKKMLPAFYDRLFEFFGPQKWWPARSRFEIIVGAILTQNTSWKNVEKAIKNLRSAGVLNYQGLKDLSQRRLASLIKPAGYYNIKAERLKNFINFLNLEYRGNLSRMLKEKTLVLRQGLLKVKGIGKETADSIILYAAGKPVMVIDAYTKRIFSRHRLISPDSSYDDVQELFMDNLPKSPIFYNEFHALIVRLGKEYCVKKPRCDACPIATLKH